MVGGSDAGRIATRLGPRMHAMAPQLLDAGVIAVCNSLAYFFLPFKQYIIFSGHRGGDIDLLAWRGGETGVVGAIGGGNGCMVLGSKGCSVSPNDPPPSYSAAVEDGRHMHSPSVGQRFAAGGFRKNYAVYPQLVPGAGQEVIRGDLLIGGHALGPDTVAARGCDGKGVLRNPSAGMAAAEGIKAMKTCLDQGEPVTSFYIGVYAAHCYNGPHHLRRLQMRSGGLVRQPPKRYTIGGCIETYESDTHKRLTAWREKEVSGDKPLHRFAFLLGWYEDAYKAGCIEMDLIKMNIGLQFGLRMENVLVQNKGPKVDEHAFIYMLIR